MTKTELEGTEGGSPLVMLLVTAALATGGFVAKGIVGHWEEFSSGIGEGYKTFA